MRKIVLAGLLVIGFIVSVGLVNAVQNGYGPGDGDGVCDGDGSGPGDGVCDGDGEGNKNSNGYGDGDGICNGVCDGDSEQFQYQIAKGNCYKNRFGYEDIVE
jgi:hypothetical protein